jgi:hypothetical protein
VPEEVLLATWPGGFDPADIFVPEQDRENGVLPLSEVGVGVRRAAAGELHAQQDGARRWFGNRILLDAEGT